MVKTPRDQVRSEVLDACAAHYCPKDAAFLASMLLDPIPHSEDEEFRRIGLADFFLQSDLPVGTVLGLLSGQLNEMWGDGPCPVAGVLYHRGRALYREWWDKRLREHEAALWRIRMEAE
jgi:hypothetical protein